MRKPPPKKKPGMQRGPRVVNGAALDVRTASVSFFGWPEKNTRYLVDAGLLPHRRLGGRIIFLRDELEQWLATLSGVTLEQARENLKARES